MASSNAVFREGISAGLIGATAIAAWFAILDAIQGQIFGTPILLGTSLGTLFLQGDTPGRAAAFLLYTVFHFAMFCGIGLPAGLRRWIRLTSIFDASHFSFFCER